MRAAVRRGAALTVTDVPDVVPEGGQVVAKTLACGICGSDLHAVHHLEHGVEIGRRCGAPDTIDPSQDLVLGHEFCAEILDHGPGTEKRFAAGTRVVSTPFAFGSTRNSVNPFTSPASPEVRAATSSRSAT